MRLIFTKPSEEKTIDACQKGDRKAQKIIYEKYSARMLGVCNRYVADEMQAEDIMITGFLRVFDKISQFKSEGSFEGWIRKIMVNEALGYLRRNKNLNLTIALDNVNYNTIENYDGTELEVEDLLKLVNQLPDGYRTVFNLYAIEGYSHKEIAEKLGILEGTSKSQLSRARNMLQQNLEKIEKKTLNSFSEIICKSMEV